MSISRPAIVVEIDLSRVDDERSFHAAFAFALGFPNFYGANMNAWEDVMLDVTRPGTAGMTKIVVPEGSDLTLLLRGSIDFLSRRPKLFAMFLDSVAHVNLSTLATPGATRLLLLPA